MTSSPLSQTTLFLPDMLTNWPWPRAINPSFEEVSAESDAWFKSFKSLDEKSQRAFDKCDFGRLAALGCPNASREHLRIGTDLMSVLFLIDECTDVEPEPVVRKMMDVVIDTLKNPDKPRPQGEIVLGEMTRQFMTRALKTASPESMRHLVDAFVEYAESTVTQAQDREKNTNHTVEAYIQHRRGNSGACTLYPLSELHLNLPDYVFYHPIIQELTTHITDLIMLDNDMLSYNKEQATGDDQYNILTVVVREFGYDLAGAVDWATAYHEKARARFIEGLEQIPLWGIAEVDEQVREYVRGLGNWIRANTCWSFESGRYFGSKGSEYQRTRRVPLLPKSTLKCDQARTTGADVLLRSSGVLIPDVDELQ